MDQPPPVSEPQPEAPKVPTMSLAARLMNVFAIPGDVFEEVKNSAPSAVNWLVPALLFAIIGVISAFIIFSQPAIIQQIHEQQAKAMDDQVKAGKMTQAQADQALTVSEKFTGPAMLKIIGSIGAVVAGFARIFWWGFILWLLSLLFLKTRFSYLKAVEAAGLATMISILGSIVAMLLTVNFGKPSEPNLALFVGKSDPGNKAHLLLGAANVFSFWLVGVMAAALARLSGVRFAKAFLLVMGYWLALQFFLIFVGTWAAGFMTPGK